MTAKHYTDEEIAFLLANYTRHGAQFCADELGRSYGSIRQKVWHLGLKAGSELRRERALKAAETMRSRRAWTPEEDEVLLENLKPCGSAACARMLPGRVRSACIARGRKLGIYITESDTNAARSRSALSRTAYEYEPTKEEIAKAAAEIRAGWSDSDRRIAAEQRVHMPPVYKVLHRRRKA